MPGTNVLIINVFYHPSSDFGDRIYKGLIEKLYNQEEVNLEMDFKVPILGIPYLEQDRRLPQFNINLWSKYDQNVVIIVCDDHLINDESNINFLKSLISFKNKNSNTFLIPVTNKVNVRTSDHIKILKNVNVFRPLAFIEKNIVGITINSESILAIFFIEFYHRIVKLFLNKDSKDKIDKVILFLSHTKKGGVDIALKIKDFIATVLQLDKFFDVQDIEIGENFTEDIKRYIEKPETVFLTILTDHYSTRPACKMEVLYAKKQEKPILTITSIEYIEKRSFPYLNNTPVIKWEDSPIKILKIIEISLREFLRTLVVNKEMSNFIYESNITVHKKILSPPELLTIFNLVDLSKGKNEFVILYPSPFIDLQEKELFDTLTPNIKLIIPWQTY